MGRRINPSGLVIAGIGFFATRFTVELALFEADPLRFYVAGILPLAVGLGLAAFGVALTILDVESDLVQTTAVWCVIGAASMFVFGVLTIYGNVAGLMSIEGRVFRSSLSNFLIGGSVGGTLTGVYAARSRQHRRQLRQHANRLVVLNRLLRHEVLNAITAIRGYTALGDEYGEEARDVIRDRSGAIERTIEKVKYLTRRADGNVDGTVPVDVSECIRAAIDDVEARHPQANVTVNGDQAGLEVLADEQLEDILSELIENAIVHGGDAEPTVRVSPTSSTVEIAVHDDGPGLPEGQRNLLETGDVGEFDDPATGFGLNLVRFYVTEFDGGIETTDDGSGSAIAVTLSRAQPKSARNRPAAVDLTGFRPALPHLVVAVFAALTAGLAYGIVSEALGGSVAGIGIFYGTVNPAVGWITHEFHSVVFGLAFVGVLSVVPEDWPDGYGMTLVVGLLWATFVWLVAASFVAPVWLQLSGVPVDVPNFSTRLLASHLVWGATLAITTALGYRTLQPRLSAFAEEDHFDRS